MNTVIVEKTLSSGQTLQIVQGDITVEVVDAIVNAANEHLQHGGGVAWAISKKGGNAIQRESDAWIQSHGPVTHTHPAWTSGGLLPARFIIHAVGPVWADDGTDDAKLASAVTGSLRVADELKCKSISLPAISTGIFGFPKDRAAGVIFESIKSYFGANDNSGIGLVRLVLFDQTTIDAFLESWGMVNG
jgi:O-acetyl-ADP-ribose deacetylase (regulator of RNase III)